MTEIERQLPPEVADTWRAAQRATSTVERLKRWGILYICCAVTAIAIMVGFQQFRSGDQIDTMAAVLKAVRQTQIESAKRGIDIKTSATSSEKVLQTLTDCLTPGGECYKRSVQHQADVLATVQRLVVVTQLCAKAPPSNSSYRAMQTCVAGLMEAHANG